jgi:hypothetical protein
MFNDKIGKTIIKAEDFQQLNISFDKINDIIQAVFLYIPDRNKDKHYHIPLNLQEAKTLRNWLDKFIEEKERGRNLKKKHPVQSNLEKRFEEES